MPEGISKPLELVKGHRTKAEKEARAKGEAALKTDLRFKPSEAVKKNTAAYRYYKRIAEMFADIKMDDAFFENVLNRYCLLLVDYDGAVEAREETQKTLYELLEKKPEMDFASFLNAYKNISEMLLSQDRALAKKRDQLLAIEKENYNKQT